MATSAAQAQVRHCSTYFALQECQFVGNEGWPHHSLESVGLLAPTSHLQGRRIERLSASTRGALRRLFTPCKSPPDDHRVRSRRVSSPPMQRSSTSSSQNVHTQQPCSRVVAKARWLSMCTKCRRKGAREPRSSASGGSCVETCSGGSRKRLSQQTVAMQRSDGDCKACMVKLAKLEAASRAMPVNDEDLAVERAEISARIAETKSGMAENKFIGARMGAARGRHTRAQQRAKEAADVLEMAQRVVAESDVEVACIERDLHDLEAALGHAPAVPAAPGSSLRMSRNRCSCPLTASSPIVDPKLVSLATAQSAELGRQRGLQADPPKRLRGKHPQRVRSRMTVRTRTLKRRVEETRVAMSNEISE